MALHGSACSNLAPILFKDNNLTSSIFGFNVIIHLDVSGSMSNIGQTIYGDGQFIGTFQDELLKKNIGKEVSRYPNIYSFFDISSRNPSSSFTITNPNGNLIVNQSFLRGESTGSATITNWSNSYYGNRATNIVNVCTNVINNTTGGRLTGALSSYAGAISEDVHGNLWSIFTTPNAISSGTPGIYGSVINSPVRQGSQTIVITNSNEQGDLWARINPNNLIDVNIAVGTSTTTTTNISGLTARRYSGYFGNNNALDFDSSSDNVNYTDSRTPIEGPIVLEEFNRFFQGRGTLFNNTTWLIEGFFIPSTTGTHTFFTKSDDASYLWIGDNALTGYTKNNAVVKNGGKHSVTETSGNVNLVAGTRYPIRILYGNYFDSGNSESNVTELTISFSGPGIPKRTDGRGFFFSADLTSTNIITRTINGTDGEMNFRRYRVFALSNYTSTDGSDGILFYGSSIPQPFGYVRFNTSNNTYIITRSNTAPNWQRGSSGSLRQEHDTLTLASETRGGLFKIQNINTSNRLLLSRCIAEFTSTTL